MATLEARHNFNRECCAGANASLTLAAVPGPANAGSTSTAGGTNGGGGQPGANANTGDTGPCAIRFYSYILHA